jgi:hypothetical protein
MVQLISVRIPAPNFEKFKLKDTEKAMRKIKIFYFQKALDAISREAEKMQRDSDRLFCV